MAKFAPAAGSPFERRALRIGDSEAVADRSGALYVTGERTLVVADLHLEKGSAFAARGVLLPPYDTRETLDRLAEAIRRYEPRCVVALGDSLHDRGGADRLGAAERDQLRRLQSRRDWIWLTGNHDPEIDAGVGGEVATLLRVGGLLLRHEPAAAEADGEVAGHLHPAARVAVGGVGLRLRCFIGNGRRLVMPAFGAFTGGLNVLDAAFRSIFGEAHVQVLGRDGIYPVAWSMLAPD